MAAERMLVIDAGTSSLRAVAVTPSGATDVIASEPWDIRTPADAEPFGREFDPTAVTSALHRLLDRSATLGPWSAVAFTGQREGLAFVAADGEPVCVAPNIDARASAEGMEIDARHGDEVYAATGHLPSLMQATAKLAWLRRHRADDASRVDQILPLADWLASTVTGERVISRSLAVENGMLDLRTGFPPAYLAALGVAPSMLPGVVADGEIAGRVRSGALSGVPVVLAGGDTQCALAGIGALAPGDAVVPAGWSAPVQVVTPVAVFDEEMRTWTGLHVAPGRFILESNASETGRAWDWICSILGHTPDRGAQIAAEAPAGSDDVMAVLGPRAMRASAMIAGVGALTLPLPLVMTAPTSAHLLRSVLESTAYAIRANLEQAEAVAGTHCERLGLAGGMSRSVLFRQILCDVIDRPVEVAATPEATALGAAMLASVAVGLHPSLEAAADAMASAREIIAPRPAESALYDDCYARWCAMAGAFERIAGE